MFESAPFSLCCGGPAIGQCQIDKRCSLFCRPTSNIHMSDINVNKTRTPSIIARVPQTYHSTRRLLLPMVERYTKGKAAPAYHCSPRFIFVPFASSHPPANGARKPGERRDEKIGERGKWYHDTYIEEMCAFFRLGRGLSYVQKHSAARLMQFMHYIMLREQVWANLESEPASQPASLPATLLPLCLPCLLGRSPYTAPLLNRG